MVSKKAQAALEFLSTYAWAFLVIVGVLGTMAYFGFGNVKETIPNSCNLGTAFECGGYIAITDGSFAFEFINHESKAVNISDVICSFPRSDEGTHLEFDVTDTDNTIARGDVATIVCPTQSALEVTAKDQYKVKIVYFLNETDALPHVVTGELIMGTTEINDPLFAVTYMGDRLLPTLEESWFET